VNVFIPLSRTLRTNFLCALPFSFLIVPGSQLPYSSTFLVLFLVSLPGPFYYLSRCFFSPVCFCQPLCTEPMWTCPHVLFTQSSSPLFSSAPVFFLFSLFWPTSWTFCDLHLRRTLRFSIVLSFPNPKHYAQLAFFMVPILRNLWPICP